MDLVECIGGHLPQTQQRMVEVWPRFRLVNSVRGWCPAMLAPVARSFCVRVKSS